MKRQLLLLRQVLFIVPFTGALIAAPRILAQAGPALEIQRSHNDEVLLQWTPDLNINVLEASPTLGAGEPWRVVGPPPEFVGLKLQVTPERDGPNQFFRLVPRGLPGTGGNQGTLADPSGSATLPPPNAVEDFATSTAFLYTGNQAVQLGVLPETMEKGRASVLRGKVKKRDGSPLPGVRVAILNFPQFGYTYSRADGIYDLVVNGGPNYTLDYQAMGYCPAQRQAHAPPEEFRSIDEVVLVPMDPIATSVTFGDGSVVQVARSSVQTDLAGTRSATIVFPAGTSASLLMPDGSSQAREVLTIRATEFTVGSNGRQAMPGPLPPTSAYTYAVELSGDEAVAAGAMSIQFNQFVHVYVDNFLSMPPGVLIPSGYYDRQLAAWVPQENGVVIQIVGSAGGAALVDVNGDGQPEEPDALATAEFTEGELQHLAATYPVNKTLWRMPAKHFTAMDYNCPENASDPGTPNRVGDQANGDPSDASDGGGRLHLSSQVFEETIPLVGVPAALHYSSARVPGFRKDAELHLPLTGATLPPSLVRVEVEMDIAGRIHDFEFPPSASQYGDFGWDGIDAYGRLVNETRRASFRLSYLYPQIYGGHPSLSQGRPFDTIGFGPSLFGNYGQLISNVGYNSRFQAAAIQFERLLTIPDHRKQGLGGWSLDPHHRYDPVGKILYLGDGRVQRPASLVNGLSVSPLDPTLPFEKVAAASDGSMFLVRSRGPILRRLSNGQLLSLTAAASGPGITSVRTGEFALADGKLATQVNFDQVGWQDIAVGPDDSLYLRTFWSIVRLAPDGVFRVVLGLIPSETAPAEGSLARAASASSIGAGYLSVGPDHSVYYTEVAGEGAMSTGHVRKISPDGRITTLMGPGGRGAADNFEGYGGFTATAKTSYFLTGVAVGPDGSVYVSAFGDGIVRIAPGGILESVMNGRATTFAGHPDPEVEREVSEGTPAVSPTPNRSAGPAFASSMKVGPDGSVYFANNVDRWHFLWRITGGLFQRVAGRWNGDYAGGAHPLQLNAGNILDYTIDTTGAVTILSQPQLVANNFSLRRIGTPFPGFDGAELQVASSDATEIYIFNAQGLHLRTLDALSGTIKWLFTYDSRNLVIQMQDSASLVTTIERSASGGPTAIVGPYGQRTTLNLDASGYLASVTNPAGESATLSNGTTGLLSSITGPRGNSFTLSYDGKGRASRMSDPAGGSINVAHSHLEGADYSTAASTGGGDTSTRLLKLDPNGDSRIVTTAPDGTVHTEIRSLTGGVVSTAADGTVFTLKQRGDPRFPGQTRVPEYIQLEFPGGLKPSVSIQRSAVLAEADNPFSLTSLATTLNLNGQVFSIQYEPVARRSTETTPTGRQETIDFNSAGRIIRRQSGGDSPLAITHDSSGRPATVTTGPATDLRTSTVAYTTAGLPTQITDPLGRTTHLTYDIAGRPLQLTLPDGAKASFEHDAEDHLTSVTPPGRPKHQFKYNTVGSLTQYVPPVVTADESVNFTYDLDRHLTTVALPDGQNWLMLRGPAGRPRQWKLGSGPDIDFTYHPSTGQLTRVASSDGQGISFDYQGALPIRSRWTGTIAGEVSRQFDNNLRMVGQSVNGTNLTFAYDTDGLITRAADMAITRDAVSGRVSGSSIGLVNEVYAYNADGRHASQTITVDGSDLVTRQFTYDRLNRVSLKLETIAGTTHAHAYAYDAAGRLSEVKKDGALMAAYTYDANGNRLSRNGESAVYDAQDRLISYAGATFTWSPNGHRLRKTEGGQDTFYSYDVRGALKEVTKPAQSIQYDLDPLGRRIGRRLGGVLDQGWLWQDFRIVAEVNPDSVVTKRFVYGTDRITPELMIAGTTTYRILADERGSVRFVVNTADGTLAQAIDYDEFGRVVADTNPGFQPFGFAGGIYDAATGLIEFGERDYDPQTGQWTARDPVGFFGGQFSLYAYVGNDPVNQTDPFGTGPFPGGDPEPGLNGRPGRNRTDALARIYDIVGNVYVTRDGQTFAAKKEEPLYLNDRVSTDKNSKAAFELLIGGRVGVAPGSTLQLTSEGEAQILDPNGSISPLRLRGGVWDKFMAPARPLTIQTRGGGSIRG